MKNMNFTDWQDLWLKKDVEKISKTITEPPVISITIIINLIIVTLTLAVTAMSIIYQDRNLICIIIILAILSIVLPILILLIYKLNKHCKIKRNIINKNIDIKDYVSIFDNKVCSYAMMADSLFEHMKAEDDIATQYYFICEINFYINKCIDSLYDMKSLSNQIFMDNTDKKCVSPKRLRLILKLLNTIREQTYKIMTDITDKDKIIEDYINEEIKNHDDKIVDFIKDFNANNKDKNNNPILNKWVIEK